MDWSATGSMLQGMGTLAGAATVLAAAIIGSNTFKAWRQQKLAERRIDQAERILTATYKVRRELSRIRSPIMLPQEFEAAEASLKESGEWEKIVGDDSDRRRVLTTQAYYNRLNRAHDFRNALEESQPMARALFGEVIENAIEKLNHQIWTVKVYVDANHREKEGMDVDLRKKIDNTIYEGYPGPEKNEMDRVIIESVRIIEDVCVPILRLDLKGA